MLLILLHLIVTYIYFWLTGYAIFTILPTFKPPQPLSVILPLGGFIVQIPLLSFLSLYFPLTINMFLIISIILIVIYLIKPNTLHSSPFTLHNFPAAILLLVLFFSASQLPTLPDMWGYHAQCIQWIEKFHVVPGLGNLCSKYAFNFGTFLPLALLSFRPLTGQPIFTFNAFLFLLVILYVFYIIKKINQFPVSVILLLSVLAVFHYFKPAISSTSVECSSSLLLILLFFLYLSKNYHPENKSTLTYMWIIVGLILILPVIKLSNAVFLLLLLPFLWKTTLNTRISIILISIIVFFPWIWRNIMLSGYLFYPFPQFDLIHIQWAIHKDIAWQDYHWIRSWARIPFLPSGQVLNMPFLEWVRIWASHVGFFTWFFVIIGIISSTLALANKKFFKSIPFDIRYLWTIVLINIIVWFVMAPDPRFIISSILLFSLIPILYLAASKPFNSLLPYSKHFILSITIVFCIGEIFLDKPLSFNNLVKPPQFPSQKMKSWQVGEFTFHSPETGVNCYDYPIPCSPFPRSDGFFMMGTSLQQGFNDYSEYIPADFPTPPPGSIPPPPKHEN